MNNIKNAPFFKKFSNIIDTMYKLGWNERNAGNITHLIEKEEIEPYLSGFKEKMVFDLGINAKELNSFYILVTGSGKYFRNIVIEPENISGIIKINDEGSKATLLWGLNDGSKLTSEIDAHISSHLARLKVDKTHRTIIHTHATNINILSSIYHDSEIVLSQELWKYNTENIIIFPEGIGLIPWEIPGNSSIAKNTAKKFLEYKIVIWPLHGVIASGPSLDDTFGLIETVDKACHMYLKIKDNPNKKLIPSDDLIKLAKAYNVTPNKKIIEGNKK